VTTTIRRLPGFAIAAVALALSASLAFAAQPVGGGLANAASHSGKSVPTKATDGVSADQDTDEATETETETEDPADAADNCTVDLTQDVSVLLTLNHGSVVCSAAQMDTPDDYANHGAWVSHWAHLGKDKFDAAPNTHGNSKH
jgi:hypothetical protein